MDFDRLPGGTLVRQGLEDLAAGRETEASLLVLIGSPRLARLGISIPAEAPPFVEHRLYERLAETDSDSAHSRYNALIRLLLSFERAGEYDRQAKAERIQRFARALGAVATRESRFYFTGEATAVLLGWRTETAVVEVLFVPESDELLRALPELKEQLELNIELASPKDFVPELPGWDERSVFVGREGSVSFYHYDFYSQALAKIERGHAQDRTDVEAMLDTGLVVPEELRELFEAVEPHLYKYPAIDPPGLRRAIQEVLGRER